MFYSTDPASHGYVLTSDGHTVRKSASDSLMASAPASSSATATVSPLPSSGGPSAVWPLTLVAALVLVGSGAAAVVQFRRGSS